MTAPQGPRDAGVPMSKGAPSGERKPEAPPPPPKQAPTWVLGPDPTAGAIERVGNDYFFLGSINGVPTRFRFNPTGAGVQVPVAIATAAGVVGKAPPHIADGVDWVAPAQNLVFGSHRVQAVMAKIVPSDATYIDVGPDVMKGFRVVDYKGARVLAAARGQSSTAPAPAAPAPAAPQAPAKR